MLRFYRNSILKSGLVSLLFFQSFTLVYCKEVDDDLNTKQEGNSQIEVTAVFIKCEPDEQNDEATRFEREQLFKHSALKDCTKKLAVTVKITSKPNEHSGDEYIPLEHVFDGAIKRRVRLLNPYILRMHWSPPLQAYRLRRTDTVTGVLSNSNSQKIEQNDKDFRKNRNQREAKYWPDDVLASNMNSYLFPQKQDFFGHGHDSSKQGKLEQMLPTSVFSIDDIQDFKWDEKEINHNLTLLKRGKRHEHSISIEDGVYDDNIVNILPWNNHPQQSLVEDSTSGINEKKTASRKESHVSTLWSYDQEAFTSYSNNKIHQKPREPIRTVNNYPTTINVEDVVYVRDTTETDFSKNDKDSRINNTNKHLKKIIKRNKKSNNVSKINSSEREFALYEIGKPDLWYIFNVQLYEKLTTPEGKTIWNDMTRGETASVSSLNPEWTDHDSMNVRYRPLEWISKEEFALPSTSLCLLESLHHSNSNDFPDDNSNKDYIVVPIEDVIGLESDRRNIDKRHENYTHGTTTSEVENREHYRRVVVRVSRALLRDMMADMNIVNQESDQYLTFPHLRSYRAQIDLEVRADDNQLVYIGNLFRSAGRIATVVADNTRQTRAILTIQATNMGLAAARFRAVVRDCAPELSKVIDDNNKREGIAGPVLLPPRHTRRLHFVLPLEIPGDLTHCLVALVNDADESVAVRDVTIKKGDRCFCVWHCDCVCLSEDPRLLCREMSESQQRAAGLSPRDRPRQVRSVCYEDVVTLNIFVVITGVFIALLFLGLLKAMVGLFCQSIAIAGLHKLIQMPRRLDHYYESSLSSRRVVYDCEGWPIHPDTKNRTVRLISRSMEFMLNLIYFVIIPCLAVRDAVKHITTSSQAARNKNHCTSPNINTAKNCYSSHDIQNLQPRWEHGRKELRKWMTTQAQELSADLWRKGLAPLESPSGEVMQPLLQESRHSSKSDKHVASSCVDSEQDDTEYVLMQMQKSRESLVKCHRKPNEVEPSSARNQ